jgi:hypothetical protein
MIIAFYILAAIAFYGLAYRNAPEREEVANTHPIREAEIIYLYPEESDLKAA